MAGGSGSPLDEDRFHMSDAEELARKERRRRLIERLNEKEKLIGPKSPGELRGRPDERGGAGGRDREAEGAERCPARWVLVLLGFTFSSHQSS